MKFTKLNSARIVNVRPDLIDWDGKSPSKFQFQVKQFFKPYWINCLCSEEMVIPGSLLRIDLINFNRRVVVEASGDQHMKFTKFFHSSKSNYLAQIKRDVQKEEWAERNGFHFVEIYQEDMPLSKEFLKEKFGLIL